MTQQLILTLVGLFLVTALTNVLATLKSILMAKKIMNPVYLLVFTDAMIFATVVSKVTSSKGIHFALAYALGKTMGVFIGGIIEERLALGILEVDIFLNNKSTMIELAEKLRGEGYTVNNFLANGNNGDRRYKVEVVIKRKEFKVLEDIMDECDIANPTLKVKNLNRIEGKITSTRMKTVWLSEDGFEKSKQQYLFSCLSVGLLAKNPNIMNETGKILITAELAEKYGFTDIDGKQPKSLRAELW